MKSILTSILAAAALICATAATAAPLKLKPADPQPSALRNGLSVRYAYPEDIKSVSEARAALKAGSEAGPPLKGLDYRDTNEGDITLTSKRAMVVAARIKGYVRFDAPGTYDIDFLTNDGLDIMIGGQRVGYFEGRVPCTNTVITEVEVPVAGWYPLSAVYYQRLMTSCLHMRKGPVGGSLNWMPNSAFGH